MTPLRRLVLLLACTALASAAHATTYLELSPSQILAKADLVFVGTVQDVTVIDKGGTPWTRVTFLLETPLKGPADATEGGTLDLDFLGGEVAGGETLSVSGMPRLARGERVLLMAYDRPYASPVVGFRQGLWRATEAGLVDLDGRNLSVDDNGALTRGDTAATVPQALSAIRDALGLPEGTP